jgi:hypothetical protein
VLLEEGWEHLLLAFQLLLSL